MRLTRRRQPESPPPPVLSDDRRVVGTATALVRGATPQQVWDFVRPAAAAVQIEPHTTQAFTVPGTGPGVGEEQVFVSEVEGREVISRLRVTEEVVASHAEAVVTNGDVPQGCRWTMHPAQDGTEYSMAAWRTLPAGTDLRLVALHERTLREGVQRHVQRVKELVELGSAPGAGG